MSNPVVKPKCIYTCKININTCSVERPTGTQQYSSNAQPLSSSLAKLLRLKSNMNWLVEAILSKSSLNKLCSSLGHLQWLQIFLQQKRQWPSILLYNYVSQVKSSILLPNCLNQIWFSVVIISYCTLHKMYCNIMRILHIHSQNSNLFTLELDNYALSNQYLNY